MIELKETTLPGVMLLKMPKFIDNRGIFVKTMHQVAFSNAGFRTDFSEQFYTVSKKHVLRGMHCQLPPYDHAKLVTCAAGKILDVVVDLRRDLPSFGSVFSAILDASKAEAIYIPQGCAHGFLTLSDEAITLYNVTSIHEPANDSGVHWKTIGFAWPISNPIVSARDQMLTPLENFKSTFKC